MKGIITVIDYKHWIDKIIEFKGPDVKILLYGSSYGYDDKW